MIFAPGDRVLVFTRDRAAKLGLGTVRRSNVVNCYDGADGDRWLIELIEIRMDDGRLIDARDDDLDLAGVA